MPAAASFEVDRLAELAITLRELEILGLIAEEMSNREIADRLFVSENTVKTHSVGFSTNLARGLSTARVRLGEAARLIP